MEDVADSRSCLKRVTILKTRGLCCSDNNHVDLQDREIGKSLDFLHQQVWETR